MLKRSVTTTDRIHLIQRVLVIFLILTVAFSVRALTANFISAHLNDAGWFPFGIYAAFDAPAQDWLDGRASIFWIDDTTRTDEAIYPPGYPLWVAFVYRLTGSRSVRVVQRTQWVIDSFAVLLVIGIGVTAFNWRIGLTAGAIGALWPLLATYGAVPLADSPTSWLILAAVWMLLLAAKRKSLWWSLGTGLLMGASCWLRANAMLLAFVAAVALLFVVRASLTRRLSLSLTLVLASMLMIAPIVWRNAVAFHAFVPTGLGTGTNLLEGIGETVRGASEFGAPANDAEVLEQERIAAQVSAGTNFALYYPDGIERDRNRTRRALAIIKQHPVWYAGTVLRRMAGVLKYAGQPNGIYGSAGINVTSAKTLAPRFQGGIVALVVNLLGMAQSVLRYLLLPLMLLGILFAIRCDWRVSAIILSVVFYYLFVGSLIHTHIRYGLPMQALLTIFASLAVWRIAGLIVKRDFLSGSSKKLSP